MKWLSAIGAVASILGAIWAFYEARKAAASAKKAEKVRKELIERRKMVEMSQLYAETSRILRAVSAVGPSCNPSLLRGVNCGHIAREVEEYCRFVNEQRSHFADFFDNSAQQLCGDLAVDIEALAEAGSFDEKKSAGKRIYNKINNFMPAVKALADEKRERPNEVA